MRKKKNLKKKEKKISDFSFGNFLVWAKERIWKVLYRHESNTTSHKRTLFDYFHTKTTKAKGFFLKVFKEEQKKKLGVREKRQREEEEFVFIWWFPFFSFYFYCPQRTKQDMNCGGNNSENRDEHNTTRAQYYIVLPRQQIKFPFKLICVDFPQYLKKFRTFRLGTFWFEPKKEYEKCYIGTSRIQHLTKEHFLTTSTQKQRKPKVFFWKCSKKSKKKN